MFPAPRALTVPLPPWPRTLATLTTTAGSTSTSASAIPPTSRSCPSECFATTAVDHFQDVTTSGGFGNLQKGHAIAFADIENTGNEDVFEELGGAFQGDRFMPVLYHNPGHGNHSISLILEGVKTNRAAFGARIKVTIAESGRERSIYREVGAVSSFGGNPMRQHIGVGKASVVKEIEVWWPVSGLRQRFKNSPSTRPSTSGRAAISSIQSPQRPFEIGKTKIASTIPMQMP